MVTAAELGLSQAEFEAATNMEKMYSLQAKCDCTKCGASSVAYGDKESGELLCDNCGSEAGASKIAVTNFTNAEVNVFEAMNLKDSPPPPQRDAPSSRRDPPPRREPPMSVSSSRKRRQRRRPSGSEYEESSYSSDPPPKRKNRDHRRKTPLKEKPTAFAGAAHGPAGMMHMGGGASVPQQSMHAPLHLQHSGPPPAGPLWASPPPFVNQQPRHRNPFLGRGARTQPAESGGQPADSNPFCKGTCMHNNPGDLAYLVTPPRLTNFNGQMITGENPLEYSKNPQPVYPQAYYYSPQGGPRMGYGSPPQ